MEPEKTRTRIDLKIVLIIGLLIVMAGMFGWILGNSRNSNSNQNANTPSSSNSNGTVSEPTPTTDVQKLVSYSLPDGWKEGSCENAPNRTYILPTGTSLDCGANPSAPIKMYVDPAGATDCEQLGNVQNVRKHICRSQFINGKKTLVALTEYPESAETPSGNTNSARYYLDTGKGVIKVEYVYGSDNKYQMGFDELANSIKVK